jgi:hypothetical protein
MKIGVGIPVFETVPGEALGAMLRVAAEIGRTGSVVFLTPVGMNPHDRARQFVTNLAIDLQCDRLFFIDADTIVPLGGFGKLMKDMDETGAQAVSGHYYRRGYPYTPVWSKKGEDGEWCQVDATSGLHEIGSSGLGCCLLDLKWINATLKRPYYSCEHTEDGFLATDDITFFKKISDAGGKLLGDADVRCGHVHVRLVIDSSNVDMLRREQLHLTLSELEGQHERA